MPAFDCYQHICGVQKKSSANEKLYVKDFELIKAPDEKDKEEIKQPPVKHEVQQVATRRVTIPIIVRNDDVKPEDRPPANDELDNVQIGLENKNGTPNMGAPPLTESTGNVEAPKQIKHGDDSFHQVQIEAQFPGGLGAWTKYLESNLRTEVPLDNGAPAGRYTVVVSFLVDKEGNVSDIKALNDPGYGTTEEAVRIIKKSKQWTPAIQNGRSVNYHQQQSITFVVEEP